MYTPPELLNDPAHSGTSVPRWAEYRWSIEWRENASRLHAFTKDTSPTPTGISFPRLLGSNLTASKPALVCFAEKCTNWAWRLERSVSVAQRSKQLSI